MSVKAYFMFAKSLIFPKTERKSSARRSFFGAMICIGLSIIPMVVVLSITNGMIDGMTQRLIGLSTNHIKAYVASDIPETETLFGFKAYANSFLKRKSIRKSYPEINISALATGKKYRSGIQIRAVDSDIFERNEYFKEYFKFTEGEADSFTNDALDYADKKLTVPPAIVGQKAAQILELHPGDNFRIITTKNLNGKITPKLSTFKVSSIVSSGYQELDALWVFIPLDAAYSKLSLDNAEYNILLESEDAFSSNLPILQKDLQTQEGLIANFYRWDELHRAEFSNFSSTKVMLILIMMLIILVATVNISSAIIMMVMERKKEIAIMKSLGAKPKGISFSFILCGVSCGLGGLITGLPIGLLISVNANSIILFIEKIVNIFVKYVKFLQGIPLEQITLIKLMDPAYYLQEIPVNIPFGQLLTICFGTLLLSFVVSVIPSKKAGKEKPLDILRKA